MIGVVPRCRRLVGRLLPMVLDLLPQRYLESLIAALIGRRTKSLPADESLRMLFRLEAMMYQLEGRLAVAYGAGVHTKHRHTRYHDFFVDRCRPDDRVLDIGCGWGELSYDIAERAGSIVTGLDMDTDKIAWADQHYSHPRLEFRVSDVLHDDFAGRCHVVVLSNILEHLSDRREFLRRVVEATQPSRILVRVPLFERDWRIPLKRELGVEWRLDPTHETEYSEESFEDEMTEAGLMMVHRETRWGEVWAEVRPSDSE